MTEKNKVGNGIWYTLLFSIFSFYLIFKLIAKVPLKESFSGINWFYIGMGFISLFLVWLAKSYRMHMIGIGMGLRIELLYFLRLYLATCFISHVTPFNSGGTALQIYLLHKKGITLGKATALTVVDLGLNTAMFFILIPVALITNLGIIKSIGRFNLNFSFWPWLLLLLLLGVVTYFLYRYTGIWEKIKKWPWINRIGSFIQAKKWRNHLQQEWSLFKESWLLLVRENPNSIFWAVIATIMYWFFYLLLAPIIFWAIGKPISFFYLISWQLLFNFGQIFIPTPGGSGGSELLLLYLFRNLTGPARVGTFVLLWKTYTFYSTLIAGGYYFWRLTKKNNI